VDKTGIRLCHAWVIFRSRAIPIRQRSGIVVSSLEKQEKRPGRLFGCSYSLEALSLFFMSAHFIPRAAHADGLALSAVVGGHHFQFRISGRSSP
jgi:hypothetical protein